MMINRKLHILLLLGVALYAGCSSKEDSPSPHVAEGLATQLRIVMPENAYTKNVVSPPVVKDNDESVVQKLWMNTLYPSTVVPSKADKVDARVKGVDVKNPTMVTVNSGVRDLYTAVNLTDATMITALEGATTKTDITAIDWTLGATLPASPFVMSSVVKGQTLVADESGVMSLDVKLKTLAARLDLTVEFDALSANFATGGKYEGWRIVIDHLQLANLPGNTPLFESEARPPYTSHKQTNKLPVTSTPNATQPSSWSCANKFYITENLFADKTDMTQSTFVVIYARALPPPLTAIEGGATELPLVYKIAIGNHVEASKDFTIRRNNKYILKIKLVGLDPDDRVFIDSRVMEWIDDSRDEGGIMGYPSDANLQIYQFEGFMEPWAEDARDIDKIGLPWIPETETGDGSIGGEGWKDDKPGGEIIGEK